MKYVVQMASGGMICIPKFMTFGSDIQAKFRLLPQHEMLQCSYYRSATGRIR
jgi:hypothetical protein